MTHDEAVEKAGKIITHIMTDFVSNYTSFKYTKHKVTKLILSLCAEERLKGGERGELRHCSNCECVNKDVYCDRCLKTAMKEERRKTIEECVKVSENYSYSSDSYCRCERDIKIAEAIHKLKET